MGRSTRSVTLSRGIAFIVVIVIIAAVAIASAIVVYYLNSQRGLSTGFIKGIVGIDYKSMTNDYSQTTSLSLGYVKTQVNWDDKAVAAIAFIGKMLTLRGVATYWTEVIPAKATKVNNPAWYEFWPAPCYKAVIVNDKHFKRVSDVKYTEIKISKSEWLKLGISVRNFLTPYIILESNDYVILRIPVSLVKYGYTAEAVFYEGSKGWFSSCTYDSTPYSEASLDIPESSVLMLG
ncbi:MAG: hypothetical protein GXO26_05925 [Crenarchaeota archaeon]|nr:hypothetical protein [Thermoproteota archaeon]